MIDPLPFQKKFIRETLKPNIRTSVLSIPRGNGKSHIAAHLLSRFLDPKDPLYFKGKEIVLLASSIEQARHCFNPVREFLEPTGLYRFRDSERSLGATNQRDKTKLRVQSSNAKSAMGLVNVPIVVADEPGSWEVAGGTLMFDAIQTAMGKPESDLKAIYIGTIAPSNRGWWQELVEGGSNSSTYVQALQGNPKKWKQASEIKRCNPLMWKYPKSREVLFEERDKAIKDTRLKARFLSYRLNIPTQDEAVVLLTVDDWERVLARAIPEAEGTPVVGLDLGAGRSWSSAVAIWENGRVEAIAQCPGIPSIEDLEKRDQVGAGEYQALVEQGSLLVAKGRRVQPTADLVNYVVGRWNPDKIVVDRFRAKEIEDHFNGEVVARVTRWSEAAEDVRALRKWCQDKNMAVAQNSQRLIEASLAVARVKSDDQGNTRLVKNGFNSTGRDDVAASKLLAVGELDRDLETPKQEFLIGGI